MANTARETAPQSEEKKKASMDEMLNNKQFLEALVSQENLDVENLDLTEENEELKEKYEVFGESKKVSKELVKLCENQIFAEAGIRLDEKEFDKIGEFLGKKVFENPQFIENLREQMAQFKELPKEIVEKEAEIEELTGGRAGDVLKGLENAKQKSLDEKRDVNSEKITKVTAIKEKAWFFRNTRAERKENKYEGTINNLDIEIAQITDNIGKIKDVSTMREKAQAKFQESRGMIFQEITPIKEIFEKAKEVAKNKIKELGDPSKDLASSEKAIEYLQKLKSSAELKGGSGHDFLEGFELEEGENPEESLDKQIKGKIYEKLKDIITSTEVGLTPLTNFENKLRDLIYKEKIGSMDEEESKQFIVDKLKELRKWHSVLALDKIQNIVLGRIIIKLEAGV